MVEPRGLLMAHRKPPTDDPVRSAIEARRFMLGGEEFAVLTIPHRDPTFLDGLTSAEREVCRLLLAGLTNTDIARDRGTSPNTTKNQIASIFRKLGVVSRAELAARSK
jgi:DNA-binding NarL/FixJ family response regulator